MKVQPARRLVHGLLARLRHGHLTLAERDGSVHMFGDESTGLRARVDVHDDRAYGAIVREGSIGYGRGFIEDWWTSDDPTAVTRLIIQNMRPLDDLRTSVARATRIPRDALSRITPRAGRKRNREDIAAHYDIGNDFFGLFLDETMTYSGAVFASRDDELAAASTRKYQRLLDKLALPDGGSVLEIGSGWGGFARHVIDAAEARITTTTISAEQHRVVTNLVDSGSLHDRVNALRSDWRDLPTLGQRFDRIVSIEMIEAVDWRDYPRYFAAIESCLQPDGMVALQAICVPERRYESAKYNEDYIRRFVFPGGMLPSVGALVDAACGRGHLQLLDVEDISRHYAETLRRWRERFDDHLAEATALGFGERFQRLWRMYLAYCEAAFLERHINAKQLVFVGPAWRDNLDLRVA